MDREIRNIPMPGSDISDNIILEGKITKTLWKVLEVVTDLANKFEDTKPDTRRYEYIPCINFNQNETYL